MNWGLESKSKRKSCLCSNPSIDFGACPQLIHTFIDRPQFLISQCRTIWNVGGHRPPLQRRGTLTMDTVAAPSIARGILRYSRWDALLIALSLLQPFAIFLFPSIPVIAFGLWWNSNTISHNFIHLPFFRSSRWNWA